ncbi:MAG TPA: PfkB family carbohydrate kinase, partial [Tepidisphaeraceae bacterium]
KQVEAEAWDRLREKIDWLLAQARLVVLSGSLTPGAPQDFYAWCVERAHEKNVRALVDASGEPLKLALEKKPFLVKPNRVELTRTVGTEDLWEGINRLMQTGARNVIVTMGKEGSVAADGRTRWKMAPPGTEVVSPIGSGDAYAAGTAAALDRGDELVEAARLGTACAAANAMTAVSGYLRREDVEAIVPKVQIEMLKH